MSTIVESYHVRIHCFYLAIIIEAVEIQFLISFSSAWQVHLCAYHPNFPVVSEHRSLFYFCKTYGLRF